VLFSKRKLGEGADFGVWGGVVVCGGWGLGVVGLVGGGLLVCWWG